jgi:hypothetical protein
MTPPTLGLGLGLPFIRSGGGTGPVEPDDTAALAIVIDGEPYAVTLEIDEEETIITI